MARRTVAIVGGGCAGVLLATRLLRCTDDDVVLVDPGTLGGGLAYGAAQPWHLLNSRAGVMGAHPEEPGHFAAWAGARPHAFLPRRRYGEYLAAVLDAAAVAHPGRLRPHRAQATAVHADDTGAAVRLDDGRSIRAAHAVLAVGNPASSPPSCVPPRVRGLVIDPWRADLGERDGPVLLLGSGLTAVDAVLTLAACGAAGPVEAVSRRGLLPQAHAAPTGHAGSAAPPPEGSAAVPPQAGGGLRDLLRALRDTACGADDWRTVVDGLRPELDRLWAGLGPGDQDRFLRHVARHWEAHRHRMAPPIAAAVDRLRATGYLRLRAGGLRNLVAARGGLTATFADGTTRWYATVVDCTGPARLPGGAPPLVRDLLATGEAALGPHALGLDADADGRLIRVDGVPHRRLWLLGPLRRGRLWETTAVPEIRGQAARVAAALAPRALLARAA